jgi:ligand-binding SRPBCC domain-containing protein
MLRIKVILTNSGYLINMYCLKFCQKLPISLEESWAYFSSPHNLKDLTPNYLGFKITNDLEERKMYEGQIISYIIHPLWNLPIEWVTEITHVDNLNYFIDEQRFGPYKFWHHEHRFKQIKGGVEMSDVVYYKLPFGAFGCLLHALKVKSDLKKIFEFREEKLKLLFGVYKE